jgi:hypothetical protein
MPDLANYGGTTKETLVDLVPPSRRLPAIHIEAVAGGGFIITNTSGGRSAWASMVAPTPTTLRRIIADWARQAQGAAKAVPLDLLI